MPLLARSKAKLCFTWLRQAVTPLFGTRSGPGSLGIARPSFRFVRMPKGIPRGASLPNLSLGELLEAAIEKKRRKDDDEGRTTRDGNAVPGSSPSGVVACTQSQPASAPAPASLSTATSRPVGIMKAKPKCRSSGALQVQAPSSPCTSLAVPSSTTSQLMEVKPKVKAKRVRTYVPPVHPTTRGNKATALAVASDPDLLTEAMKDFEADVYSTIRGDGRHQTLEVHL